MKTELSHKDLVKLGLHESRQGQSLNDIEADFSKKGISRKDTLKALKEVEYYNKRDEALKAKETEPKTLQDKPSVDTKSSTQNKQSAEKKSSFWFWIILAILIGAGLYLYSSSIITFK